MGPEDVPNKDEAGDLVEQPAMLVIVSPEATK